MLVGEKWRAPRDVVIRRVQEMCGVNLEAVSHEADIVTAIAALEALRRDGVCKSDGS
jgi:hypothetical protein